jgi:hypothetical protein
MSRRSLDEREVSGIYPHVAHCASKTRVNALMLRVKDGR